MNTGNLKNDFHSLIDSINNEKLLSGFYSLMKKAVDNNTDEQLWNILSAEQQEELLLADEESKDDSQLISGKQMKEKHFKWL